MESKNDQDVIRELLANERTFLAWVRTGIALMTFGFVVVKFSMFVRQLGLELGQDLTIHKGYSHPMGILIVGAGALACIYSFIQYRYNAARIRSLDFRYSTALTTALGIIVILLSILLIAYLVQTAGYDSGTARSAASKTEHF